MQALLLLAVVGCDNQGNNQVEPDETVQDPVNEAVDGDSDGFTAATDCDDGDAAINPGAAEICDGLDNDCSGVTDDDPVDAVTFYVDADGDGFGGLDTLEGCELDSGLSEVGGDCDDTNAEIHPDTWWYDDDDLDGFGDPDSGIQQCNQPGADYILDGTDCDDDDITIHPAADEVCDTIDNNCDGSIDDETSVDAQTFYADLDTDGWGDPSAPLDACWQPDGYELRAMDCDDGDAYIHPLADEVCGDGIDSDCTGLEDNGCSVLDYDDIAHIEILGSKRAGEHLVQVGDITGDGYDDVLLSTPGGGTQQTGAVYLVEGPVPTGSYDLDKGFGEILVEGTVDDSNLSQLTSWGDVDGDGEDDLVVGTADTGIAYVFYGPMSVGTDSSQADIVLTTGDMMSDVDFGNQVYGSGNEIIVGNQWAEDTGGNEGAVYILPDGLTGSVDVPSDAVATLWGDPGDTLGNTVQARDDLTGDGVTDLLIGAPGHDGERGAVYAFAGPLSGSYAVADATMTVRGEMMGTSLGYGVEAGGDTNGDGYTDIFMSAPSEDLSGTNAGSLYIIHGPIDEGDFKSFEVDNKVLAEKAYAYFGGDVDVGDVDGDGADDLMVGTHNVGSGGTKAISIGGVGSVGGVYKYEGGIGKGPTYLFYGPVESMRIAEAADVILDSTTKGGFAVGINTDLDGDGLIDLLATNPHAQDPGLWGVPGGTF